MGAERINAVKTSFFGKGALSLLPAELKKMGIRRGLIVTLGRSERIPVEEGEIEIIDADTFLSE